MMWRSLFSDMSQKQAAADYQPGRQLTGHCGLPGWPFRLAAAPQVRIMPKALAALAGQALEKILTHLQEKLTPAPAGLRPASRASPADLFG